MILVTGGTGHLGANLVRRLVERGDRVRVLVRSGNRTTALDGLPVELATGDVRDPGACAAAVRGCEAVHHCAAFVSTSDGGAAHKRAVFETNVLGTRNVLAAARAAGVRRVVVTGSLSAVGHLEDRPTDESVPFYPFARLLPYSHTK